MRRRRPTGALAAPVRGITAWLPQRFEVGQLDVARARLRFRDTAGLEIAFCRTRRCVSIPTVPTGRSRRWRHACVAESPAADRREFPFQGSRRCIFLNRLPVSAWGDRKGFRLGRVRRRFEAPHRVEPGEYRSLPQPLLAIAVFRNMGRHRLARVARKRNYGRKSHRKLPADRRARVEYGIARSRRNVHGRPSIPAMPFRTSRVASNGPTRG